MHHNPSVFNLVGIHAAAFAANGGATTQFLTDNLREICAVVTLNLPDGVVIASPSWREMGWAPLARIRLGIVASGAYMYAMDIGGRSPPCFIATSDRS